MVRICVCFSNPGYTLVFFSIGNLQFAHGILDEKYMYEKVKDHRNILSEIVTV